MDSKSAPARMKSGGTQISRRTVTRGLPGRRRSPPWPTPHPLLPIVAARPRDPVRRRLQAPRQRRQRQDVPLHVLLQNQRLDGDRQQPRSTLGLLDIGSERRTRPSPAAEQHRDHECRPTPPPVATGSTLPGSPRTPPTGVHAGLQLLDRWRWRHPGLRRRRGDRRHVPHGLWRQAPAPDPGLLAARQRSPTATACTPPPRRARPADHRLTFAGGPRVRPRWSQVPSHSEGVHEQGDALSMRPG